MVGKAAPELGLYMFGAEPCRTGLRGALQRGQTFFYKVPWKIYKVPWKIFSEPPSFYEAAPCFALPDGWGLVAA